jgi:two-component system osmolarity sensor histidine kinase EnvZ
VTLRARPPRAPALGLAIVDKTVQRMGGIFALANTTSGGLAAHIKLQKPKPE